MVKIKLITAITAIAILVGCGSYASTGAYTGATLGSILGSAIGGITGGPRGSDIGQIVGMGVGGVVGATIGEQADKKVIKGIEKRRKRIERERRERSRDNYDYYNEQGQYYQPAVQDGVINYSNGPMIGFSISKETTTMAIIVHSNHLLITTWCSNHLPQMAPYPSK